MRIREHEAVGFYATTTFRNALQVSSLYRRRGIGAFLVSGDPEILLSNLRASALAFLSWTNVSGAEGVQLGALLPLFDAIGCGDEALCAQFGKLSATPWASGYEYEEDYLFAKLIMHAVTYGVGALRTREILERYEHVAASIQDVRYTMCAALCAGDAASFDHALEVYLTLRRDQNIALASADRMPTEEAQTEAKVLIEGVALVRIGASEGLILSSNYPLVADLLLL